MRLIIAGGRNFGCNYLEDGSPDVEKNLEQYDLLCDEASHFIVENVGDQEEVTIISGLARGADTLGCQFAQELNYTLEAFAAEWNKYGRSAGIRRNKLMAKSADFLIAFWDGKSRGTMHMIDFAAEKGLKVKVVEYAST